MRILRSDNKFVHSLRHHDRFRVVQKWGWLICRPSLCPSVLSKYSGHRCFVDGLAPLEKQLSLKGEVNVAFKGG